MLIPIALWLFSLPVMVMFGVFTIEVTSGLKPRRDRRTILAVGARTVILIPAHNEGESLASTIATIFERALPGTGILVVADNCADTTAAIARDAGAHVIERNDADQRGKGHALAFGRDWLRSDPPECVIVLDADCVLEKGSIERLRDAAMAWGVPVQASNLLRPDRSAPPMVQISSFAFLVKNLVRQRGATRIGGAALLNGTGMAFPWIIFKDAPLASSDIVEDLALGIHLTRRGAAPRFLESAQVFSEAAKEGSTLAQRTRWEHGFVGTAKTLAIPLVAEGIAKRRWPLFWLGLHLMVPPLALLVLISTIQLAVLGLVGWLTGYAAPAIALGALMAVGGIAVLGAWVSAGRETLDGKTVLKIPIYALWKIPVYLKLSRGAETTWIRTKRPHE